MILFLIKKEKSGRMTEEQSNQEYVVKMNGLFFFSINFQALFSILSAYSTLGGHQGMM